MAPFLCVRNPNWQLQLPPWQVTHSRWLITKLLVLLWSHCVVCSSDCSYSCHLECAAHIQLDCNQRDRKPQESPHPRSHCSSAPPRHKVSASKTEGKECEMQTCSTCGALENYEFIYGRLLQLTASFLSCSPHFLTSCQTEGNQLG